jgi:hypothetical protein
MVRHACMTASRREDGDVNKLRMHAWPGSAPWPCYPSSRRSTAEFPMAAEAAPAQASTEVSDGA